jgi:hypothetical protein
MEMEQSNYLAVGSGAHAAGRMATGAHDFYLLGHTFAVGTAILVFFRSDAATSGVRTFFGCLTGHMVLLLSLAATGSNLLMVRCRFREWGLPGWIFFQRLASDFRIGNAVFLKGAFISLALR